jgi:hypothetical protein
MPAACRFFGTSPAVLLFAPMVFAGRKIIPRVLYRLEKIGNEELSFLALSSALSFRRLRSVSGAPHTRASLRKVSDELFANLQWGSGIVNTCFSGVFGRPQSLQARREAVNGRTRH